MDKSFPKKILKSSLHYKRYQKIAKFTNLKYKKTFFEKKIPAKIARKIRNIYKKVRNLNTKNSYFYQPKTAANLKKAQKITKQKKKGLKGVFIHVGQRKNIKVKLTKNGIKIKEKNIDSEIFVINKKEFLKLFIKEEGDTTGKKLYYVDSVESLRDYIAFFIDEIPAVYTHLQLLLDGNKELPGVFERDLALDEIMRQIFELEGYGIKFIFALKAFIFKKQASVDKYQREKALNEQKRNKKVRRNR